jgi:hypothetical protein
LILDANDDVTSKGPLFKKAWADRYKGIVEYRGKHNAVDVQLEKDRCATFAYNLATQRGWGTDIEIAEACHKLEPRLKQLKEKLIFEVLKHGTI